MVTLYCRNSVYGLGPCHIDYLSAFFEIIANYELDTVNMVTNEVPAISVLFTYIPSSTYTSNTAIIIRNDVNLIKHSNINHTVYKLAAVRSQFIAAPCLTYTTNTANTIRNDINHIVYRLASVIAA